MMISLARAGPTKRMKRVVEATPRGTPRSTSGIQSCASAADGVTVDHGDGRLLEVLDGARDPLEEPTELALVLLEEAPSFLVGLGARVGGIGTGGEDGRGARQDQDSGSRVVT